MSDLVSSPCRVLADGDVERIAHRPLQRPSYVYEPVGAPANECVFTFYEDESRTRDERVVVSIVSREDYEGRNPGGYDSAVDGYRPVGDVAGAYVADDPKLPTVRSGLVKTRDYLVVVWLYGTSPQTLDPLVLGIVKQIAQR